MLYYLKACNTIAVPCSQESYYDGRADTWGCKNISEDTARPGSRETFQSTWHLCCLGAHRDDPCQLVRWRKDPWEGNTLW